MGQSGKNKVVIHVECIHDPTFEIANYRPAGSEHVRELVLLCVCVSVCLYVCVSVCAVSV